jgi:hypothetical protein
MTHGQSTSPEYIVWHALVHRCTNRNAAHWRYYGGAKVPVRICARWLNSFEAFLADMGPRPKGTSLGRTLDSHHYVKANCSWQTSAEQGFERRGKTAMLAWHNREAIDDSTRSRWKIYLNGRAQSRTLKKAA